MNNFEERKLILSMQAGSQSAYKSIYINYYERLCRYTFSLCKDEQLSEDIAQEVLLQLWERRKKKEIKKALTAYLFSSARNKFIDQLRKSKVRRKYLSEQAFQAIVEIEELDETERQQRLQSLYDAIESMPPKRKEVFILNKIENLKYKEVAERLQVSERTVESHIRNAMIFLKDKLLIPPFLLNVLLWYYDK